jgi:hypothetical protein
MMSPRSNRGIVEDLLIPEGYTCRQIFALLEEKKVCTAIDIAAYAASGELKDYWFLEQVERGDAYCLEGFLFPDTYDFYEGSTPREALGKMLLGFEARFSQAMRDTLPVLNERLAAKMKASKVYGIDIDAVAAISAYDNARLNRVGTRIETYCGDASLLQRNSYDVLLANINRNILLQDIPTYSLCIRKGGLLFVSGFYVEDMPMIVGTAMHAGLEYVSHDSIDNWCCIKFKKA